MSGSRAGNTSQRALARVPSPAATLAAEEAPVVAHCPLQKRREHECAELRRHDPLQAEEAPVAQLLQVLETGSGRPCDLCRHSSSTVNIPRFVAPLTIFPSDGKPQATAALRSPPRQNPLRHPSDSALLLSSVMDPGLGTGPSRKAPGARRGSSLVNALQARSLYNRRGVRNRLHISRKPGHRCRKSPRPSTSWQKGCRQWGVAN